ncbi:phage integrase N-terminal SAM-like domain-containing protein [Candidatus Accumulibacter sp. ACC003]|uniref:phage integrase N-terminal SAM-like domain-containing protein n=1 Tax=Candidatus Accumulibacter sp. ACC003 TaxID=2823334 RepID=UPI0025C3F9C9|nr:phage integrase N-terminal SAM-like domain-containing protein [Candidatus Accumulibacter sp. ACC003]
MEDMPAVATTIYDTNYELHQKHLKLKGLQPKTIDAYSRAIRRVGGGYFAQQIDDLSEADLLDYFADLRETHSWSSLKRTARVEAWAPSIEPSIVGGDRFITAMKNSLRDGDR